MAEIGTATVRIKIDTKSFRVQVRRVRRHLYWQMLGQAILGIIRG